MSKKKPPKGPDLFDYTPPAKYPDDPGHKGIETSAQAAESMRGSAPRLRAACLKVCSQYIDGVTADECAAILEESILSIRPRFSELNLAGKIYDSKERRPNFSGRSAAVWKINPQAKAEAQ